MLSFVPLGPLGAALAARAARCCLLAAGCSLLAFGDGRARNEIGCPLVLLQPEPEQRDDSDKEHHRAGQIHRRARQVLIGAWYRTRLQPTGGHVWGLI